MLAKQLTTEEGNGISESLNKINQKKNKFPEETPPALSKYNSPSLRWAAVMRTSINFKGKDFPLKCGLKPGNLCAL